ncbi:uncharacterized protein LOC110451645 [Mizuhopecten yessoensis]|uniref:uncharacterized protein LOC110451645 n=1 Tax=Mizuhopecten yessoensis TaxID=6573 RepID=UPI000B458933|nr:uncharacterized protein LOC110451645 [Mizuhopecten yessoensis]
MGCGQSVITIEIRVKRGQMAPVKGGDGPQLPKIMFGTYKVNKKCTYQESHHMYVFDARVLTVLPPPHVPHTRKNEIFQPERFERLDKRALSVSQARKRGMLIDLVEWLIKPCKGYELAKLRVLYRWLTSWDIKKFKPPLARIEKGSVLWYILRLQNKQENYAAMMCYLCSYAGLVCMVVHGFMKGSTYKIGQNVESNKINMYGEWNAVLIDNVWRHVNAYWGACAVTGDDDESTTFHLDETFFIPDPETLAYTHFPDEPKWQLLDRQMSMKDFERRAFVKERFFELDMRILSHPECEITCHDELEILFGIAPNMAKQVALKCLLSVENEEEDWVPIEIDKVQHDYAHVHNANSISVQVRFPEKGTYKLEILGKDLLRERREEKYIYDWLVVYKIYVKKVAKTVAFPRCDETARWGPNLLTEEAGLKSVVHPFATVNADGGYLDLAIRYEDIDAADSEIFYKITTLDVNVDDAEFSQQGIMKEENQFIIFNDKPPANEYGLCLYVEMEEEQDPLLLPPLRAGEVRPPIIVKKNVCNFMVRCTSLSKDSKFREIDNARKAIVEANKEKRLADLERIVDLIETREFERYMSPETVYGRELIQRLRKLQNKLHEVMILDTESIMKLRDLVNPDPEVFAVMKSLLLFVGHFDEELRQWSDVQKIIGRSAKMALRRRIGEFDINELDLDIALGAKKLLGTMELEKIQALNPTLGVFMDYVIAVVEEMELRYPKKLELTVPRTTREVIQRSKKVIALLTMMQPKVEPEEEFEEYDFF